MDPFTQLLDEKEVENKRLEDLKAANEAAAARTEAEKVEKFRVWVADEFFGSDLEGKKTVTASNSTSARLTMNKQTVYVRIENVSGRTFRDRSTRTRLAVEIGFGGSDDRRNFPQKQDGSYSWDKAAAFAKERSLSRTNQNEAKAKENQGYAERMAQAKKLCLDKGLATIESYTWGDKDEKKSYYSEGSVFVRANTYSGFYVEFPKNLTLEQASKIADLAVEMGLTKQK